MAGLGIGFSLFDMPGLAGLAAKVVAEEQALRRPVAVAIVAEPLAVGPGLGAPADDAQTVEGPPTAEAGSTRAADLPVEPSERTFDVPIRLAPAPA